MTSAGFHDPWVPGPPPPGGKPWGVKLIVGILVLVVCCGLPIVLVAAFLSSMSFPGFSISPGDFASGCDHSASPLVTAAAVGNMAVVRRELDAGTSADVVDGNGRTPLYCAAWFGQREATEALLAAGANVNNPGEDGDSPLIAASRREHSELAIRLVNAGADPNRRSAREGRPIVIASTNGDPLLVAAMLDHGADPNRADSPQPIAQADQLSVWNIPNPRANDDALDAATESGAMTVVNALLDHGADPNRSNALGRAAVEKKTAIATTLLDHGADPNRAQAMRMAATVGADDIALALLDHGADPNAGGPVIDAARAGSVPVTKLLLDHGADPNASPNRAPALFAAAAEGHEPVVEVLLEHGADPNQADPLAAAIQNHHDDVAAHLLSHGASPNGTGFGLRPLLWAVQNNDSLMTERLLHAGADPDLGGNATADLARVGLAQVGLTGDPATATAITSDPALFPTPGAAQSEVSPLLVAAAGGRDDLVNLLLTDGADPNRTAFDTYTPIYLASVFGHASTVRALLAAGATATPDVGSRVPTPIDAARQKHHDDVVAVLDAAH